MSKHRVLSFKPQLRLEWRGQDGQNETEQPDHSASLGDSITSSTQIRFSVHTGASSHALSAGKMRVLTPGLSTALQIASPASAANELLLATRPTQCDIGRARLSISLVRGASRAR